MIRWWETNTRFKPLFSQLSFTSPTPLFPSSLGSAVGMGNGGCGQSIKTLLCCSFFLTFLLQCGYSVGWIWFLQRTHLLLYFPNILLLPQSGHSQIQSFDSFSCLGRMGKMGDSLVVKSPSLHIFKEWLHVSFSGLLQLVTGDRSWKVLMVLEVIFNLSDFGILWSWSWTTIQHGLSSWITWHGAPCLATLVTVSGWLWAGEAAKLWEVGFWADMILVYHLSHMGSTLPKENEPGDTDAGTQLPKLFLYM